MPAPEDAKSWEDQEGEVTDMAQTLPGTTSSSLPHLSRPLTSPPANAVRLPSENRGEQAAAALEANLSALHSRLDAMLAGLEPKEAAAAAIDKTADSEDKKPRDGGVEKK
ncbi:hypothetical protein TOPH_00346 [Tolypocladium ophioglossoides CBS 100239]|uniref:Uncharacterized protein n=1 Tax=Tolypocladium ophioglossoides (strain CBS 100239) TaxID=1163406 RepID=A0A0L0NMG5_TOLOC|nr:hypothetical protein TOPH_00346 [Tolypocladium ophioglossoides CBS 100239]